MSQNNNIVYQNVQYIQQYTPQQPQIYQQMPVMSYQTPLVNGQIQQQPIQYTQVVPNQPVVFNNQNPIYTGQVPAVQQNLPVQQPIYNGAPQPVIQDVSQNNGKQANSAQQDQRQEEQKTQQNIYQNNTANKQQEPQSIEQQQQIQATQNSQQNIQQYVPIENYQNGVNPQLQFQQQQQLGQNIIQPPLNKNNSLIEIDKQQQINQQQQKPELQQQQTFQDFNNVDPQKLQISSTKLTDDENADQQTQNTNQIYQFKQQPKMKMDIITFSNKWINRYFKYKQITNLLKVPIDPAEEDTLCYVDIFNLRDIYQDYEFDLSVYNPQRTISAREGEDNAKAQADATFLNRNKYLLQYIMNFFTEENLNLTNLPEGLKREILNIIGFIQQACGYNHKKKSFRFTLMSHCHYHLLFLKINYKNLNEMMKREQDVSLHNECFGINLEDLRSYYISKDDPKGAKEMTSSQQDILYKVYFINFIKMCIHELVVYHIKDHIIECSKNISVKNADKEYEERAFLKIAQMNQGQYMNRF